MIEMEYLIVTDVGNFPMPDQIKGLYIAAKKRRDGAVDGRTKSGKQLLILEKNFRKKKLREYLS